MRESFRILPVYTGDVSGVCSALYELGGMVVIHDPSGCNSTYNTHDEVRWYDQDSLIFLTGLKHRDALLGNDQKLIDDTVQTAKLYAPKFITLCNSPIPFLNGTDFKAVAHCIERACGIPTFYVSTNAMHDYTAGAGEAFEMLAKKLVPAPRQRPRQDADIRVNILGVTPLDYTAETDAARLRRSVEHIGFTPWSCWAMGDTLEQIERAGEADVNLVVSGSGLRAARYFAEGYGIPYVVGVPLPSQIDELAALLRRAVETGESLSLYGALQPSDAKQQKNTGGTVIIGENITALAMAEEVRRLTGETVRVLGATEEGKEVLVGGGGLAIWGEEECESALGALQPERIIADPLYAPICPKDAEFVRWPHLAMSGRIYLREMPDILDGWKGVERYGTAGGTIR